jgi:hypothetical protein
MLKVGRILFLFVSLLAASYGGGGGATTSTPGPASPVFTSSASFSAAENQTAIGTVTATDSDSSSLTYSISGSELAMTTAGVLSFVAAPDYETKNSYTATVTASDGTRTTTQNITVTVTDNASDNRGSIVNDQFYSPFTRYIDVGNLRIFSRPVVSNAFIETVASTYEAMLVNTSSIDITMRDTFLNTLKNYSVYQRLGYIGPSNYPPESQCNVDPSCVSAIASGSYLHNVVDYIWEVPGAADADTLNSVLEHLLHTITSVGFNLAFPFEWGVQSVFPIRCCNSGSHR